MVDDGALERARAAEGDADACLLAIECATRVASVALLRGHSLIAQQASAGDRNHAETLLGMVDAVLLIHMLSPAVANMNPPTSRTGSVPTANTVTSAIRRCSPQRSMPRAIMNPPMKRKMNLLA